MADEAEFESIAEWLTSDVKPFEECFDETQRRRLRQRVLRLNEAKAILREAAERVNEATPGIWQLLVANAIEYSGQALLGFLSTVRGLVKKAGLLDLLIKFKAGLEAGLAKLAQRYARFWGQNVPVSSTFLGTAIEFVKSAIGLGKGLPSKAKYVIFGMEALSAKRMAEMVERQMIGVIPYIAYNNVMARALPQRKNQRRRVKLARSRSPE